jgi:mono/diheme cytochrome c family protein
MGQTPQSKAMTDRKGRHLAACRLGRLALATLTLCLWAGSHALGASPPNTPNPATDQAAQMPGQDRLARPVLPESPTQVDIGRNLYYYHCMPCHGDRGQGLTDEWREVWVEDHQNCWGRGCHAARSEMDGFYIPRTIPAVIGSPPVLGAFQEAEDLFAFLRATQPPQRPGALTDAEYWALTDFLLHENGRPLSTRAGSAQMSWAGLVLSLLAPLLALTAVTRLARRPPQTAS